MLDLFGCSQCMLHKLAEETYRNTSPRYHECHNKVPVHTDPRSQSQLSQKNLLPTVSWSCWKPPGKRKHNAITILLIIPTGLPHSEYIF